MIDWGISDLHLGHTNCITKFTRADGTPLRDFKDVEEMNKTIIDNINRVVGKDDRLFILGDVVINKKFIPLLDEINCKNLILLGGNHDRHYELLQPHFKEIHGCLEYRNCILTHIPVHPSQKYRFKANLHGHLHANNIMLPPITSSEKVIIYPDPWYVNLSVEQINYTPINLQELTENIRRECVNSF
jgi:calcineurin-like phosphoesterase family protein